jgi:type IV pilus assembly protein PilA
MTTRSPASRGFTLVELMIVVVILGVLAAVAVAAFTRYVKRSKAAEASTNLGAIYHAEVAYYNQSGERFEESGFVAAPELTPNDSPGSAKYPANVALWVAREEWATLGFALSTAHYYAYMVEGPAGGGPMPSLGPGDAFTARAVGNLDGDGVQSTYLLAGTIAPSGELQRDPIEIVDELE